MFHGPKSRPSSNYIYFQSPALPIPQQSKNKPFHAVPAGYYIVAFSHRLRNKFKKNTGPTMFCLVDMLCIKRLWHKKEMKFR